MGLETQKSNFLMYSILFSEAKRRGLVISLEEILDFGASDSLRSTSEFCEF